ncbi:hypothetical protein [Tepidibacillus sp. HK-1]|nr:hypothetical protein [Tepidibacillus sp. HK-1]GBF10312.1 hypothetical protein HK1_00324 [Tepidibacillus sp. HK-1]
MKKVVLGIILSLLLFSALQISQFSDKQYTTLETSIYESTDLPYQH